MPKTSSPETIAEMLHDFNGNLNVTVKDSRVVATIPKLNLGPSDLRTLAQIAKGHTMELGRSGGKLRMVIQT